MNVLTSGSFVDFSVLFSESLTCVNNDFEPSCYSESVEDSREVPEQPLQALEFQMSRISSGGQCCCQRAVFWLILSASPMHRTAVLQTFSAVRESWLSIPIRIANKIHRKPWRCGIKSRDSKREGIIRVTYRSPVCCCGHHH